jgi:hypothetical protein
MSAPLTSAPAEKRPRGGGSKAVKASSGDGDGAATKKGKGQKMTSAQQIIMSHTSNIQIKLRSKWVEAGGPGGHSKGRARRARRRGGGGRLTLALFF